MGSIDRIGPPGTLIATGDLHDNPDNFERLIELARLTGVAGEDGGELLFHRGVDPWERADLAAAMDDLIAALGG